MLLRTNLTGKTMRAAEGRANKALAFCVAVMIAILLELLLVVNPAYASTFTVNTKEDPQTPTTAGCDVTECTFARL
jgi:hypothetical protein